MEKFYSMKEVSEITGLSYDTLKYYSNEGLVPDVKRDRNNYRIFDEKILVGLKVYLVLRSVVWVIKKLRYIWNYVKKEYQVFQKEKKF